MAKKFELVLDRFEGTNAVLLMGKKELILPKNILPKDAKESQIFQMSIASDKEATKAQEKTARELLNEILKNS